MKERDAFARHFREVQPKFGRLCLRSLSRSGLTMPQYALLNLLAAGPVPMKDLSTKLHVTKPAVTNLVDRLENHDFLRRTADAHDRRVTMIEIRPKGEKLVREMQSTVLSFLLNTLGKFSATERRTITRFYEMLSKNFDQNLKAALATTHFARHKTKLAILGLSFLFIFNGGVAFSMARRPGNVPETYAPKTDASGKRVPEKLNFENFFILYWV